MCLLLYGYSNVIVANERSSDEGNVFYREKEINHQYSKSFRFETRFDEYLGKYLVSAGRYFSFLRPLYELQIGKLFSNFHEFWGEFRSCNRNRSESWCGQCAKCVSVFLTMYPFVSTAALTQVFGSDLFYSDQTIPILRQLAGLEVKPFECVATTREIVAALSLAIAKTKEAGESLPPVLEYAAEHIPGATDSSSAAAILGSYGLHSCGIGEDLEVRLNLTSTTQRPISRTAVAGHPIATANNHYKARPVRRLKLAVAASRARPKRLRVRLRDTDRQNSEQSFAVVHADAMC